MIETEFPSNHASVIVRINTDDGTEPMMNFPIESIKDHIKTQLEKKIVNKKKEKSFDPNYMNFNLKTEWKEASGLATGFIMNITRELDVSLRIVMFLYYGVNNIDIDFEIYDGKVNDLKFIWQCIGNRIENLEGENYGEIDTVGTVEEIEIDHNKFKTIDTGYEFSEVYTLIDCLIEKEVLKNTTWTA